MAHFFNFKQDYFGLTESEVDKNLSLYGLNTYSKNREAFQSFSYTDVFLSPSVLLMFIAGILSFFAAGIVTGIMIILIDAAYVCADIFCRKSSDDRLGEIEDTAAMKFRVIRGGKPELIEKEFIVPEDTIVVQAGERVPADAFILEAEDVTADESVFTGSNKPVAKYVGGMSKSDLKPTFVYSGTIILTGRAVCKVSATGVDTHLYQHRGEVTDTHPYFTNLERIVRTIVPMCSCVALVLTLVSMIIEMMVGRGVFQSAINGITLGLCFIPTGIGSLIRIYYTKGAMDFVKNGAVVKSFTDIEKLNSLSVLCVEKEGAISKNRLEVRNVYTRSEELLYKVAALSCEPNSTDPAERALMVKATFFDEKIKDVYTDNEFIDKIPDDSDSITGAIWNVGGSKICCIKGGPELILPMCKMSGDALFNAKKKYEEYYSKGCSVLAVACVDVNDEVPDLTAGFSYTFVGFIAFSAPLRDSVSSAVKTCRRAGVRVVMLTEDNPSVAESTGKMIGLYSASVITGSTIERSMELGEPLDLSADIYAKITREQKLHIIDKLRESGAVVAMTGIRPEDANALEAADVGITVSQHAAGCTYEAADIIMNDDNFSTIADMIASARQIHRNIKRAVSLLISGYSGMILLMTLNLFNSTQLMLTPAVIALVSMLLLPVCALGFVGCSTDMKLNMPPSEFMAVRKINYRFIGGAVLFGLLSGVVAIASYMFMYNGTNSDFARSCSLISYCICTALFAIVRLSVDSPFAVYIKSEPIRKVSIAIMAIFPILLVYIPFINSAFGLAAIDILALLISIISGVLPPLAYFLITHFVRSKESL